MIFFSVRSLLFTSARDSAHGSMEEKTIELTFEDDSRDESIEKLADFHEL